MLTAASLIMVSTLPGKQAGDYNYKVIDTRHRMQTIEDATKGYMAANGRRPCPADGQYAMSSQYFGVEAASPNPATPCVGGTPVAPLGPDAATTNVVAGVVPTKTLNLPDDAALDAWGRQFTYFVDRRATAKGTCATLEGIPPHLGSGAISVKDSSGGVKDYVMYAYISHGPDGYGAWPAQGSSLADRVNTGSRDASEQDNASVNADFSVNFDNVIVQKEKSSVFDDIVYYGDAVKNTCCLGPTCANHATPQVGLRIDGKTAGTETGMSLAVGDVNGDGIPDLIIGAPGTVDGGLVYVVFGTQFGFPDPLPLSSLNGSNGFVISNAGTTATHQRFGWSVATGDVNGDGINDIIIGAPQTLTDALYTPTYGGAGGGDTTGTTCDYLPEPGHVYVVFGHKGAWPATYTLPHTTGDVYSNYDFSRREGADIAEDEGYASGDTGGNFGWSVAAGDFDGDGVADIVVGAFDHATVVYGGTGTWNEAGAGATVEQTAIYPDPGDGGVSDPAWGWSGSNLFGYAVATGHIHRKLSDSLAVDLVIGAPGAITSPDSGSGLVYVVFSPAPGRPSSISMPLSVVGGTGFTLGPPVSGCCQDQYLYFGGAVAAGDVNGDGYDDIIIGSTTPQKMWDATGGFGEAPPEYNGGNVVSSAYVVFGKASSWSDYTTLDTLTGSNGFQILGANVGDSFGASVAVGDINGDGYADVIVGAPLATKSSLTYSGSAFLMFGGPTSNFTTGSYSVASFDGTIGARLDNFDTGGAPYAGGLLGWAVAAGDINKDGYSEVIASAPFLNLGGSVYTGSGAATSVGSTFVDFGSTTPWTADVDVSAF